MIEPITFYDSMDSQGRHHTVVKQEWPQSTGIDVSLLCPYDLTSGYAKITVNNGSATYSLTGFHDNRVTAELVAGWVDLDYPSHIDIEMQKAV